ncbi:MAG TPA: peroxiredoxin family protein [Vicinamibacterales bacterium]|jgi:peroxiredoxin|nr:peroxiredoxin family protein [Vicinamibacterales bacterium]
MVVIILCGVVAASAAFTGWLAYQLLAQNGRILARLEALEDLVQSGRRADAGPGAAADEGRQESLKRSQLLRDGLPAGAAAPDFRLPRVGGGELSLSQYRGRRVLLLFSDPKCGPCNALLPDVQRRYAAGSEVDVVMVSRGDHAANASKIAELRVTFPVVLQRQWEISKLYGMFATPIAFLVDEQGTIAAPVAVGAQRILGLMPEKRTLGDWFKPRPRTAQA